jgi:hypothetical protein
MVPRLPAGAKTDVPQRCTRLHRLSRRYAHGLDHRLPGTQSGTKITSFTLATSRARLSEGRVLREKIGYRAMDTEWHRITCFNGLGKTVAEHCEKGMKVLPYWGEWYQELISQKASPPAGCEGFIDWPIP